MKRLVLVLVMIAVTATGALAAGGKTAFIDSQKVFDMTVGMSFNPSSLEMNR